MNLPPCAADQEEDAAPRCPNGDGPMRAITSCIAGTKGASWGEWWRCANHRCGFTYLAPTAELLFLASQPGEPDPSLATVTPILRKQQP